MWPFRNKYFTGIKILVTNHCHSADILKVYDMGNGAFVYAYSSSTPRYLAPDGKFFDPNYYTCNGDGVSWTGHIGDTKTLTFKES
jgi:hypothetical protein